MSKLKQDKIPMTFNTYKLVRESDGLTITSSVAKFVEWHFDGTLKAIHDKPGVGMSCILDPHEMSHGWLTTTIVTILEQRDDYIKFSTLNSIYELWKN